MPDRIIGLNARHGADANASNRRSNLEVKLVKSNKKRNEFVSAGHTLSPHLERAYCFHHISAIIDIRQQADQALGKWPKL